MLRTLLLQELQQQYGREPIRLFQDVSAIQLGANWEREIQKAVDASTFFIPIITPNFIQSEWCCHEVKLFLERERELCRRHPELVETSRIFPILLIGIEDAEPENSEVLSALQKLQWFDFRRFRHRSYDDADVREALAELASTMRALLKARIHTVTEVSPFASAHSTDPSIEHDVDEDAPDPTVASGGADEPTPAARSPAQERPIAVGDVLNHMFQVTRFIKSGGMGQVFEGSNVITGERVAIKALLPALAVDPQITALFQREAMTLTRLNHEALVQYRVLAKEPDLGGLYIVTEYIDGVDLGESLGRIDCGEDELLKLLERLASGLAAAHQLGAIHRDISPDNVMLPSGDLHQAKIIDFGIAKDMHGALPTLIGDGFAGKLNYVAPEQLGEFDGEIGPWTDVYSLGLVMLAVATGKKVNLSGSFADAIRKRRAEIDMSAAPERLRVLLNEMLKPDPAERLRSMTEVKAWISRAREADAEDRRRAAEAERSARQAAEREEQESAERKRQEIAERERREAEKRERREMAEREKRESAERAKREAAAERERREIQKREKRESAEQAKREAAERRAEDKAKRNPLPTEPATDETGEPAQAALPSEGDVVSPPREGYRSAIAGGAIVALAALLLLIWRPWTGDESGPNASPAPERPVPPAPTATAPRPAPPSEADRSWLFGRWCITSGETGRQASWTIAEQGNQIVVSYPGGSQTETISETAPGQITTDLATYRLGLPENRLIVLEPGTQPQEFEQCQ